jgi:hypothetical protein
MSSTTIPAPLDLQPPDGTQAIYITALSLLQDDVEAVTEWSSGSARFGVTLVGPTKSHVMFDKVFGEPLIDIDGNPPSKITLFFNFSGHGYHYEVSGPTKCGPEGSSTRYEVTAFKSGMDDPTVVTVLFKGKLH